jgi:hypothetical protein
MYLYIFYFSLYPEYSMEISKTAINGSHVNINAKFLAVLPLSGRKRNSPHGHSVGIEMSGGIVPHSFAV